MQDLGGWSISFSRCKWISCGQGKGQGIHISGCFKIDSDFLFHRLIIFLSIFHLTPLIGIFKLNSFVGGANRIAFVLTGGAKVIRLRNDPTPELDGVPRYLIGISQCSIYLQPGLK